jgi:putative transposase
MPEILSIINCLQVYFPKNFDTFSCIINALLSMSGSKTMLNISRYTNGEACYKTIERFYNRTIPWLEMNLILIMKFVNLSELLLVSDETLASKSGKKTTGIDFFFSSILQKPIKSLCFSGLSIIVPDKKKSYPLLMSQLIFTPEEKEMAKLKKEKAKTSKGGKKGRPKGSKNSKSKNEVLAPTFRLLEEQLTKVQLVLKLKIKHFVGDGKYGNNTCARLCNKFGLFLISKLQHNSELYFENNETYSGVGRPKKYGKRIDYKNLPTEYMVKEEIKGNEITRIYNMTLLSKSFGDKLNVVIVQKIIEKKIAHVIFFSTDLEIVYQKIIDYYSSRFQIEFNFRDAKEFWGLEDFMNIKKEAVENAANLSMFMVNLSNILLEKFRTSNNTLNSGIRDLISHYRGLKYFNETLKLLQKFNNNIYIPKTIENVTSIGFIHV